MKEKLYNFFADLAVKINKIHKKGLNPSFKEEIEFIEQLLSQQRQQDIEKIEALEDALIWCSGSGDFQEGGVARKGWLKICKPLIKESKIK